MKLKTYPLIVLFQVHINQEHYLMMIALMNYVKRLKHMVLFNLSLFRVKNNTFELLQVNDDCELLKSLVSIQFLLLFVILMILKLLLLLLLKICNVKDLTAIEEAAAYQQLIEMHDLTQESLAQRLGKSQSTIANKIRLLQLSEPVKMALMERKITERHARALLSLDQEELQVKVLEEIITKELNVKQTEIRLIS